MTFSVDSFIRWEMRSRDCIDVKRCYVDVAGELVAGVLLSQIIYWHLPDSEGKPKLKVEKDGYFWIAKKREHWWDEARISPKQLDRCTSILEKKGLVETKLYRFQGSPTKHIRLKWDALLQALDDLQDTVFTQKSISNFTDTNDTEYTEKNGTYPKVNIELDQTRKYNLPKGEDVYIDPKRTTENTTQILSPPIPPGAKEGERNFGFEIKQEVTAQPFTSLLDQLESTQLTSKPIKETIVPVAIATPKTATPKTDKFFTGKTRDQEKYDRWTETAHPALVYGSEDTPWLEPPTRTEFMKFNQSFIDWHTSRCMEKFHKQDRFQAEADFKASLRNSPESCASRWAEYHKHMVSHAATAAARMNNGVEISEVEKQKFIKHQRAFTGITAESTESIDPKIMASAQPAPITPDLESVATVLDETWDKVKVQTDEYETAAIAAPEGAENYAAYSTTVNQEASNYYRQLDEKNKAALAKKFYAPAPITNDQEASDKIKALTGSKGMPFVSPEERQRFKEQEKQGRKLAHWNALLQTGIPSVIADVERQVSAQGYEILDGQVSKVEV